MNEVTKMRLSRSTLANGAVDLLRKMILNGVLKPGERINEVHLARQMQISRGPVREALLMLQTEGLVIHEINRGSTVSILSPDDAREIYTLRGLLEGEAAQLAIAHLGDSHFAELERLLAQFQTFLEARDFEQLSLCDIAFHRVIVDAAGHSRMALVHQQMDVLVGAMFMTISSKVPVRVGKVVQIHEVLVDALRTGDATMVERTFRAHYTEALDELQKQMRQAHGRTDM
ncbi:MAG: GntR family transcriptional regulator [Bacilli bacterium]